jgi:hypothetical protein
MSERPEDPTERARKYVKNFEIAKAQFNPVNEDTVVKMHEIKKVTDAIERYLNDARYYLQNRKPVTALASIAYAEGLMDALSFLELTKTSNAR